MGAEPNTRIELLLFPVGVVTGIVLDSKTRAPIPGASVSCATFREDIVAVTDARGEFTLTVVPSSGEGHFLRAIGPDHGSGSLILYILPDSSWAVDTPGPGRAGIAGPGHSASDRGSFSPARVEILLPRARTIRGRILAPDGAPAAAASVLARAYFWSGQGAATPDGTGGIAATDGTFQLVGLRSDLNHRVDVVWGEIRARIAELSPDQGSDCDLGTIRLERSGSVRGRVTTRDGRGVAVADVVLVRQSAPGTPDSTMPAAMADVPDPLMWSTTSDAMGNFAVNGIQPGTYVCRARVEGLRRAEVLLEVSQGRQAADVELVLSPDTWCLEGLVTRDGLPAPDAIITLQGVESRRVVAASDGTFSFGALDTSVEYHVDAELRAGDGMVLAHASTPLALLQASVQIELVGGAPPK